MLPVKCERCQTSSKENADEIFRVSVVSDAACLTGGSCLVLGRARRKYLSKSRFCVPLDSVPLGVFSRERLLKHPNDARRKAVCGRRELWAAYVPVGERTGDTSDSHFEGAP